MEDPANDHDASGNQTKLNTERFLEWDYADQLKLFKIDNGTATKWAQYRYSGGQRVKKVSSVAGGNYTSNVYIKGIFGHQLLKRGNTYERNYSHIMDDSTRIAQFRTGSSREDIADSVFYVVDDHLGTLILRLAGAAALIDRQEIASDSRSPLKINKKPEQYYPFGETSLRSFDYKRYQYTGKERDEESGLYYYGARYYSAWTCRFIGVDPLVGKTFYQSSYFYADNNPIMMNDPTGISSEGGGKGDPPNQGDTKNENGNTFTYSDGHWWRNYEVTAKRISEIYYYKYTSPTDNGYSVRLPSASNLKIKDYEPLDWGIDIEETSKKIKQLLVNIILLTWTRSI